MVILFISIYIQFEAYREERFLRRDKVKLRGGANRGGRSGALPSIKVIEAIRFYDLTFFFKKTFITINPDNY